MSAEYDEDLLQSCSPEARDLIAKLMCFDTKQRLTAAQALQHEWLSLDDHEDLCTPRRSMTAKYIENLRDFHVKYKM